VVAFTKPSPQDLVAAAISPNSDEKNGLDYNKSNSPTIFIQFPYFLQISCIMQLYLLKQQNNKIIRLVNRKGDKK
jgi:hypothetical protein